MARAPPVRAQRDPRRCEQDKNACVLVSEMVVTATRVIAVTALDVCQRTELALSTPPADRFRAAAPRAS